MKMLKRTYKLAVLIISTALIYSCQSPISIYAPPQAPPYTVKEIKESWERLAPAQSGNKFTTLPSTTSPYSPGQLEEDYLRDALNMANFVRYLAHLPADLELDGSLNSKAQHGAVLLSAQGSLSHTPPKPADMEQAFYELGYSSTSSSNIGSGYLRLERSISHGYMRDQDPGNITRLGHRRWILNPPLKKLGFGEAGGFMTMQVFDRSRSENVDYDYISWPAGGNFPVEFFRGDDPWSVTLNPAKYSSPIKSEIKVTIHNLTSGMIYNFGPGDSDSSGKYFNVDTGGYGVANCIIFRPAGIGSYDEGESYEVTVNGVKTKRGDRAIIIFIVNFFKLS